MNALKCTVIVTAGLTHGTLHNQYTRQWDFTEEDLNNPPIYIDKTGAAMNYAMSLQNPQAVNWVKFEWIWY